MSEEKKLQSVTQNLIEKFGARGEKLIKANISEDEKIIVKIQGTFGEGLVITDKRLYVLKWGFMTGNTISGRCTAYDFKNIVALDIRKSLATGLFEILTPANQDTKKSYWGTGAKDAKRSENIITFQSVKSRLFQEAVKIGRELISKSKLEDNENKNISSRDNLAQLEKLAELKTKGIITQEEFDAKKKELLDIKTTK